MAVIDLVLLDEGPLPDKGIPIFRRLAAELLVHQQQGVEPLGLDPPDLVGAGQFSGQVGLVVEAAILLVPAIGQRRIDQHARDLPGFGVVGPAEHRRGLDEQEPGLHVMAERDRARHRRPVPLEIEVEMARSGGDLVAHDQEHFLQPRPQDAVRPHLIEAGQRLEDMDVRVHRLLADGSAQRVPCRSTVGRERLAEAIEGFDIAAIDRVMGVRLHPCERAFGQIERLWIARVLIIGCGRVGAESMAVQVLFAASLGSIGRRCLQPPEEAAMLGIPDMVVEIGEAVVGALDPDLPLGRIAGHGLGRQPGQARLIDGGPICPGDEAPVLGIILVIAAAFAVHGAGKPLGDILAAQIVVSLLRDAAIVRRS